VSDVEQVMEAETRFFNALLTADSKALEELLTDDFVLVDVLSGSVLFKEMLVSVIGSRLLKFAAVDLYPEETLIRWYGSAAVVVGRTTMRGSYEADPFSAYSRYTHFYTNSYGTWQLASAQGTPIQSM